MIFFKLSNVLQYFIDTQIVFHLLALTAKSSFYVRDTINEIKAAIG